VLWMMKFNNDARQNLMQNAKALGVDPQRLVFASRVPKVEDHLARFRHADVFLDTFPYNGHTTASDALLAGVPVVTLTGNSFASRVATSLLHDAGHPEWACADLASYRACALELAASRGQRKTGADVEWPISRQMQASAFGELLASI
jgi:protein O-GlcNAc transferase